MANKISWLDFEKVDIRVGTVVEISAFAEAIKPAYKLKVDFGDEIGLKKSSAQLTELYQPKQLLGKQILAVVNFPAKQIGPLMSECLVLGIYNEKGVVLIEPNKTVKNGDKLG